MRKINYLIVTALFAIACTASSTDPIKMDGTFTPNVRVHKMEYRNHKYLVFYVKLNHVAIVHDPDCKCK